MTAFAAAAAVLAADPNIGADATFTAAGGGGPVAIRVVFSRPEDAIGGLDGPRGIAFAASVMVPAAALAVRPARGDTIATGGTTYQVAEVMADEIAATYTLHLRRAPPTP